MGYHFREQESFVRIVELTPRLRKRIEQVIEHLVSILDQFDGDENLEDGGDDEPSLGWTKSGYVTFTSSVDEREMDGA